ncbi:MAG: hypothetical protein N3E37_03560 [Candidatus Micrarchaeota archaeon]|nr:hypothetical protein [Candidatus Micrarchaeota archaeon]
MFDQMLSEYLNAYQNYLSEYVKVLLNKSTEDGKTSGTQKKLQDLEMKFNKSNFVIMIPKKTEINSLLAELANPYRDRNKQKKILIKLNGIYKFLKLRQKEIIELNLYVNLLFDDKNKRDLKTLIEDFSVKEKKKLKHLEKKEILTTFQKLYFQVINNEIVSNKIDNKVLFSVKDKIYIISENELDDYLNIEEEIYKKLANIQEEIALHNIGLNDDQKFSSLQHDYLLAIKKKEETLQRFNLLE